MKDFWLGFICAFLIVGFTGQAIIRSHRKETIKYMQQVVQCQQSQENLRIIVDDLYSVCNCEQGGKNE